jgi:CelD/BcsL family acetyltransferase involved in cellulose biosynthesis
MRVHEARWSSRGESSSLGAGIGRMLLEAARELVPSDRMRLWLLEADGAPVSAQVFLVAGGEVAYWNGGFDPAWSDLRPAFETLGYAVEHAFGQGDLRVDFGGGSNPYKDRLADGDHPIGPAMVLPGGADLPLRAAQLLPERLSRSAASAAKRLPDGLQQRLRAVLHR